MDPHNFLSLNDPGVDGRTLKHMNDEVQIFLKYYLIDIFSKSTSVHLNEKEIKQNRDTISTLISAYKRITRQQCMEYGRKFWAFYECEL